MKKPALFFMLIVLSTLSFGQEDCRVLRVDISKSYNGECKKGLAHGEGEAKGEHSYIGKFKKGYPDGTGTMNYADGSTYTGNWKKGMRTGKGKFTIKTMGKDSIAKGIWKDDVYIGKSKEDGYKVLLELEVQRYTIKKVGDQGNSVSIEIFDDGDRIDKPFDIKVSSGSFINVQNKLVNSNIVVPFDCDIRFKMPNSHNAWTHNVQFKFKIEDPGQWEVEIHHKSN